MAEKELDQSQVLDSILRASFAGGSADQIVREAKESIVPGTRYVPKTFLHATQALK
jgi:hypothetical protein